MKTKMTLVVLIFLSMAILVPGTASALSSSSVALNFMCPCGSCDEALSTCECPESDKYRGQITGMIGGGMDESQIVNDFVGRFGSSVLVVNAGLAPTGRSGFNLDRRVMGFMLIFVAISISIYAYTKHFKATPVPAKAKRHSDKRDVRPSAKNKSKTSGSRRSRKKRRRTPHELDELMDDYLDE